MPLFPFFPTYADSSALTLCMHGAPLVTRYCLSAGRYALTFFASPDAHAHVGHFMTRRSPAATNSSGVSTPFSRYCDACRTGVMYSRAERRKFIGRWEGKERVDGGFDVE